MSSPKLLRASGALIAAALAYGLTACAAETVRLAPESMPTMAPEQSSAEACALSQLKVDALVAEVKDQLDAAGKQLTSGKTPDIDAIMQSVQGSVDTVTEGISNSEVLVVLDDLRTQLDEFGAIAAPESILGMPGYLADLGSRLGTMQRTAKSLQTICDAAPAAQ